ncbi:hypothetical protein HK098_004074 [Nowakowskiella sp. JEL0407]|nr:hypothetical protein HK098_004074 [Nowakowskiella sp. JEL0407]
MKLIVTLLLLLQINLLASSYSICSKSVPVYTPNTVIPITQVYIIDTFKVSGEIVIIDGCTYAIRSFTMTNSPNNTNPVWYGGNGTEIAGYPLSNPPAIMENNATNKNFEFTFSNDTFTPVSYTDFNQFRLFAVESQTVLAVANISESAKYNGSIPYTTTTVATLTLATSSASTLASSTTSSPVNGQSLASFGIKDTPDLVVAFIVTCFLSLCIG